MKLIALVAATQEGPIGIEAALLTWSPHVTFVHVWGFRGKTRRHESQGATQSTHFP